MLNVTEVRIKKMEDKGELLAYANICIADSLVVDGIKLLEGKNGRYMIMPEKRIKNSDRKRNYAYPIKEEIRSQLLEIISDKYDEETEE